MNYQLGQINFLSNREKLKLFCIIKASNTVILVKSLLTETTTPNDLHLKLYKIFYQSECNSRATNAAVDSIMHRKSAVSLQESTGCLDSFDTLFGSHDVRSLVDKLLYASTPVTGNIARRSQYIL